MNNDAEQINKACELNALLAQIDSLPGVVIISHGKGFRVRGLLDSELDALKRSDLALEQDINDLTNELVKLTAEREALVLQQQATALNTILSPE